MELKDRIQRLMDYSKMNISRLSREMGFKTPQTLRELLSGRTKNLTDNTREKIHAYYPNINLNWLERGEGEMWINTPSGDNYQLGENIALGSHSNFNDISAKNLELALHEIAAQRKLTEKAQEQIDRLIQIIERR